MKETIPDLGDHFLNMFQHHMITGSTSRIRPLPVNHTPRSLRDVNIQAYTPRMMTIGLIHRNIKSEEIQDMNKYKEIYMSRLFERTVPKCKDLDGNPLGFYNDPDLVETIHKCAKYMLELATHSSSMYPADPVKFQQPREIAKILLLDSCFILELLMRWSTDKNDSIIQNRSALNTIVHDLLLVENQIPFFILQKLFKFTLQRIPQNGGITNSSTSLSLEKLIYEFFCNQTNSHFKTANVQSRPLHETLHKTDDVPTILGLVHRYYRPHTSKPGNYMITRYTATEIFRSGIKLKPSRNEKVYLDVRFKTPCLFSWFPGMSTFFLFPWWLAIFIYKTVKPSPPTTPPDSMPAPEEYMKKPASVSCCWLSFICQLCRRATLEIPELCITDTTESLLRNLIAYEQSSKHVPNYITSYAFLMDTIINTKEHIEMLETSGVLKNYLGSSEIASDMFNNLCKNVILGDEFYFWGQWNQVDAYYKLYWPSFLGSLRVTYFSNPWTGISVFAALILFAFTGLQTACTVIQTWYSS